MKFKLNYTLPISDRRIKYTEITNQQLFTIQKYITAEDDVSITEAFDELIDTITDIESRNMFSIDKFCLLMDMRSVFLGNQLELKTNKDINIKLSVSHILNRVTEVVTHGTLFNTININDISIRLALPRTLFIKDINELLSACIYTINDSDNHYRFDDFTRDQQLEFINSLPAEAFRQISPFLEQCQDAVKGINLIDAKESIGLEEIPLNLYDKTMVQFLKVIYSNDLMSFYELQYDLISRLQLVSYNHFMEMTPNESRIFVNLHNKHIKEQSSKESTNQLPGQGIGHF